MRMLRNILRITAPFDVSPIWALVMWSNEALCVTSAGCRLRTAASIRSKEASINGRDSSTAAAALMDGGVGRHSEIDDHVSCWRSSGLETKWNAHS
jgi:hypothetical protein